MNLHDREREEGVSLIKAALASPSVWLTKAFNPDQPRAANGQWGDGSGRNAPAKVEARLADKIGMSMVGGNYRVTNEKAFQAAVSEYHAAAERDSEGLGGRLLNTDIARELSPEYLMDRTLSAAVHEPASAFIKELYARMLAAPVAEGRSPLVLFTAGGTGAGKSTGMNLPDVKGEVAEADIIFDTNMNTYSSAEKKIEQALAGGRDVSILLVHRDPVDALVAGALPRSMKQERRFGSGRTVPLNEHAKTHEGALPTVRALKSRYNGSDRVEVRAVDNSRGRGNAKTVSVESLSLDTSNLSRRLNEALDAEHKAGRISDSVYRGFKGQDGSPSVAAGPKSEKLLGSSGGSLRDWATQRGEEGLNRPDRGGH